MDYQANRQASDEAIKETTATLCTCVLSEPDDSAAATAAEGALVVVPNSSALLVVKRGPNAGSRYQLDKLVTSAGRNHNSDIYLDDVTVSRRHAEFRRENGAFQLVDLGSLNGTYVNGQPLHPSVPLADGDQIQIGKFRLVILTRPTTG
jgi:pSer/pThr/pTyr-binding forkhead associated (FHA) protein